MTYHRSWASSLCRALAVLSLIPSAASQEDYTENAISAIKTLNEKWYKVESGMWDGTWWNSANVVTVLADFALLRLKEANALNVGGYLQNTFVQGQQESIHTLKQFTAMGMVATTDDVGEITKIYPGKGKPDYPLRRGFDDFINEFYDDEGWWALAMIRSYDAAGKPEYLQAAQIIFDDMLTGLGSPCGGIYWSKDRDYVNAIANELYLAVAAALANRIPEDPRYLTAALDQWKWFKTSGMINSKGLVNDGLDASCKNNGQLTWTYNQGVILGGLVELYHATGDTNLLREAHVIARAAVKYLSNDNGVLVEAGSCELRGDNCGRDGQQFKGIFVRNLRYLHKVAPDPNFRTFILENADTVWANNRNKQNMLGVAWSGPLLAASGPTQSAALDLIVAAIAVA